MSNNQFTLIKSKLGWKRDLPDFRDFSLDVDTVFTPTTLLPNNKVLSEKNFSPIEDQLDLGSCTANAAAGIVEYMEKKAFNKYTDISRLFLYKVTRKLMGEVGDTGAYLRDTMKALRLFGALSEEYWNYDVETFDREPTAFEYAIASNYKSLSYYKVDPYGKSSDAVLLEIKKLINKGIPMMFGFTCFSSLYNAKSGIIPFPEPSERVIGGHAVTLVGYDDTSKTFKIRNSWGPNWGVNGYGHLPYKYLSTGLMTDIWAILKQDWIDSEAFKA